MILPFIYAVDRKLEDTEDTSVGFSNKPCANIPDLVKSTEAKSDPLQMPLGFTKVSTG